MSQKNKAAMAVEERKHIDDCKKERGYYYYLASSTIITHIHNFFAEYPDMRLIVDLRQSEINNGLMHQVIIVVRRTAKGLETFGFTPNNDVSVKISL